MSRGRKRAFAVLVIASVGICFLFYTYLGDVITVPYISQKEAIQDSSAHRTTIYSPVTQSTFYSSVTSQSTFHSSVTSSTFNSSVTSQSTFNSSVTSQSAFNSSVTSQSTFHSSVTSSTFNSSVTSQSTFNSSVTSQSAFNSSVTSQSTFNSSVTSQSAFNSSVTSQATSVIQVLLFPAWINSEPHDAVPTKRVYLYSAHVTLHQTSGTGTDVHIVAFQEKPAPPLTCCMRRAGHDVETTPATMNYTTADPDGVDDGIYVVALVHQCLLPFSSQELKEANITLTSSTCPDLPDQYLPIQTPEVVPGGLAICGKTAVGGLLDPSKLVEWFEVQRALGVDRIQIFDLDNPEKVLKVFRHYQELGLLVLLPFKLPGKPWGRGLTDETEVSLQIYQDLSIPIIECRLRLAGYDYVMDIDMDMVLMPRANISLKPFFKEKFDQSPKTAALYFDVKFFIEEWGPVDSNASTHMLRFLNSTQAQEDFLKCVYMPARSDYPTIQIVRPYQGFTIMSVSADLAIIHHYRKCPLEWNSCNPPMITDTSMQRFEKEVVPRVKDVLSKTGIQA